MPLKNPFDGYAIFFFPNALEVLGKTIEPYLQDSPAGPHVLCREVNTGGTLLGLTMDGRTPGGEPLDLELMLPTNMVRMIVSARGDQAFGFGPRTPVAPIESRTPVVEDAPGPAHAPEPAKQGTASRGSVPSPAGRAAGKASAARKRPAPPEPAAQKPTSKPTKKPTKKSTKKATKLSTSQATRKKPRR